MAKTLETHKAACHCGSVQFEVQISDGLNSIRRCSCSYCKMLARGIVPTLDKFEACNARFSHGFEFPAIQQFTFERGKEALVTIAKQARPKAT